MLLAIDVGNTNIVLGVFAGEALTASWRLATLHARTADEIRVLVSRLFEERQIAMTAVQGVIIASVVPPLTRPMTEMVERCFEREPLMVEPGTQTGMPVLYDSPDEVGADRVVNGVAAFEFYGRPHGQPVIVVDFGTATTFDAISAKGEYLGGIICPGVEISAGALFERAARLPRIDVRKPAQLIGRTTVGSMQSGLFYGYVATVEGDRRADAGGAATPAQHSRRLCGDWGDGRCHRRGDIGDPAGQPDPDAARAAARVGEEPAPSP